MRFLTSLGNVILDRSPDELIGALLVVSVLAAAGAALYALGSRRAPVAPTVVGVLVLLAGAACMGLGAGYVDYKAGDQAPRHGPRPSMAWGRGANGAAPAAPYGWWSSGVHVVVAADEDRDGRLTPEEAAALVRKADADGDGSVDFRDIDRLIGRRLRRPEFARHGGGTARPAAGASDAANEHASEEDGD